MIKENIAQKEKRKLEQALLKKALGYNFDEVIEEYVSNENGELKLLKKKVTKTFVPPDIPAAKVFLENCDNVDEFSKMTKEELLAEKQRLLNELAKSEKNKKLKKLKGEKNGNRKNTNKSKM